MPMDVEGRWGFVQGDGQTVNFTLKQEGGSFSGEAEIDPASDGGVVTESVSGSVSDTDISFQLGTILYVGNFAQRRLYGLSINFQNASEQVTWFAPKFFSPLDKPPQG